MSEPGRMTEATDKPETPLFERFGNDDVRALIESHPLAWVCGGAGSALEASLLPLIGVYGEDGRLVELIGHLMRSNPLYAALQRDPGGTLLFCGPQSYVSPEHAGRRDWAPTWNYAQLRIGAEIRFDGAETEHALDVLIDAMESKREQPWSVAELGQRYYGMLDRIIGFRARVTRVNGRFKLGQDETPETLHAILDSIADPELVRWMKRFNEGR